VLDRASQKCIVSLVHEDPVTDSQSAALVKRRAAALLEELMREEPIVVVSGPRAVGKTTLIRTLSDAAKVELIDFGDDDVLGVVAQDVSGYLEGLPDPVVVDEYQRLPAILRVAKRSVDKRPRPGAFLLTGSTTGELLPKSESLTGRSHELILWGLSQGELEGRHERFLELAFQGPEALGRPRDTESDRRSYVGRIVRGGYPEAIRRTRDEARQRWFTNYIKRTIDRDLTELVALRQPASLKRILSAAAACTAQIFNLSALAQSLDLNRMLVTNYIDLLERVFLLERLPAFSRNRTAQITKHPKLHMTDSGLAAALNHLDSATLRRSPLIGPLLESFVVSELRKQASWMNSAATMFHYRDRDQLEVDVVLVGPNGKIVGIEVKSAVSVGVADARGLQRLAEIVGEDFVMGIVLYTGTGTVQLGEDARIRAMPLSSLWRS
jgi:uncharacterized protein